MRGGQLEGRYLVCIWDMGGEVVMHSLGRPCSAHSILSVYVSLTYTLVVPPPHCLASARPISIRLL